MQGASRPRIGVLTTGGDCPGLNAALARLARDAQDLKVDLVGVRDGFVGLQQASRSTKQATLPLPRHEDPALSRRGGTVLGSIRSTLKESNGSLERALLGARQLRLDKLVVVGGNGGLASALLLARGGLSVVGIPKTIDNDVAGTDYAIGFHSAVDTGVRLLDQLDDTAQSHGTRFLVEVMGRRSGALAARIAEAGATDGVLLPEGDGGLDELCERLLCGRRSRVVVAEGAWVDALGPRPLTRSGQTKPGGVAAHLELVLGERVRNLRVVTFGHLLRGGSPVAIDRLLAQRSASVALQTMLAGGSSQLVVTRRDAVQVVDLDDDVIATRQLDPDAVAALGTLAITRGLDRQTRD
jgi:6-phosphofructokinase 1